MYEIVAYYSTGDSFNNYDTSTTLACCWENLEVAKLALKYLNEHHRHYQVYSNPTWYDYPDVNLDTIKQNPWYTGLDKPKGCWDLAIKLPLDDGSFHMESIPYHGYFEHLNSLVIEASKNSTTGMNFTY